MSDWAARNPYLDSNDKETCNFCGCVYRVEVTQQAGHNELEEYYCPDCQKEYKTRASISPRVTKISDRNDGRTVKYQNA
ncbi:hypothetical protein V5E38_10700 [Rossellomorea sp. GAMAL-10_SWC]